MNVIQTVCSLLLRQLEDVLVAVRETQRVGVGEYSLSGVGICKSCILVEERLKGNIEENDRHYQAVSCCTIMHQQWQRKHLWRN